MSSEWDVWLPRFWPELHLVTNLFCLQPPLAFEEFASPVFHNIFTGIINATRLDYFVIHAVVFAGGL